MKRFTNKIPGYDCIRHPCYRNGCGNRAGANHGVSAEDWTYAVSDGEFAISLRVMSNLYPESVPRDSLPDLAPRGIMLHEHPSFPMTAQQLISKDPEPCEYLPGHCYSMDGSGLYADRFFHEHGIPAFEQRESFWQALEHEHAGRKREVDSQRVDTKLECCPRCGGIGVIDKETS